MHMLHSLFYLTTALHVSGVTITHLQEHKTTVTTSSGNCHTVLLSAAIVDGAATIAADNSTWYVHHSLFYRTYCIFRRVYIIQQL